MKRENGVFYVKYLGIWLPAGCALHSAMEYLARIKEI